PPATRLSVRANKKIGGGPAFSRCAWVECSPPGRIGPGLGGPPTRSPGLGSAQPATGGRSARPITDRPSIARAGQTIPFLLFGRSEPELEESWKKARSPSRLVGRLHPLVPAAPRSALNSSRRHRAAPFSAANGQP